MPAIPDFVISTDIGESDCHHAALMDNFAWESEAQSESLSFDDLRLLAFAKAILIAADVAGSALWDGRGDEITRLENGVHASLWNHCKQGDLKAIVRARLRAGGDADYEPKLTHFSVMSETPGNPALYWRLHVVVARPSQPMNGRENMSRPDAS